MHLTNVGSYEIATAIKTQSNSITPESSLKPLCNQLFLPTQGPGKHESIFCLYGCAYSGHFL